MAVIEGTCADCGGPGREISEKLLAKGSTVREPGEMLCAGCSSSRTRLVRAVDALPMSLADIRAKRMVRA